MGPDTVFGNFGEDEALQREIDGIVGSADMFGNGVDFQGYGAWDGQGQ
jgi:hypothetical protein